MRRFPRYPDWAAGRVRPTEKQVKAYGRVVHASLSHFTSPGLFERSDESEPIPDFRTARPGRIRRPSVRLLDTIHACQYRQSWYREFLIDEEEGDALAFVGSARLDDSPEEVAAAIRSALGFDLDARRDLPNWSAALRHLVKTAGRAGVLAMASSVVGNNTRCRLDPEEFGGFALSDDRAPLVFVNGADAKAAQMFTLVHELAHLWLGETALSDARLDEIPAHEVEKWCARVAVEVLAPLSVLKREVRMPNGIALAGLASELRRLARRFKASPLIVLRRIRDAELLTGSDFREAYGRERTRLIGKSGRSRGHRGDSSFLATQKARLGERFADAVVYAESTGDLCGIDAMDLLDYRSGSAFRRLSEELRSSWRNVSP